MFCKIFLDCWGEYDKEFEIGENYEIFFDLEEEEDLVGLMIIWSRRRLVCLFRYMEDFF